jgi:hypothetical protein
MERLYKGCRQRTINFTRCLITRQATEISNIQSCKFEKISGYHSEILLLLFLALCIAAQGGNSFIVDVYLYLKKTEVQPNSSVKLSI